VKYYSQIEVEKMLEFLYERQAARVKPDNRADCGALEELADLIIDLKESSFEVMSLELGKKQASGANKCDGCKEECVRKN
jgi:hypothetical protein